MACDPDENINNPSDPENDDSPENCEEVVNLQNTECLYCNGFYGPCYEEVICLTCHAFLYPNISPDIEYATIISSEDDSDSGNDEPADNNYQQPIASALSTSGSSEGTFLEIQNLTHQFDDFHSFKSSQRSHMSINFDQLPPEVLIHAFQFLDDISLWCIGQVNSHMKSVMLMHTDQEYWKKYTFMRWPLLNVGNKNRIENWHDLYTAMMQSSNCMKCVQQMSALEYRAGEESAWCKNRLRSEVRNLRSDPPDGIQAIPLDSLCSHWQATLVGPEGSVYEGGTFFLYIQIPYTYPMSPPLVRFITKIFHPNISRHGDIGIDSINTNWSLALTIGKVLISIQSILTDPVCDDVIFLPVGRQLITIINFTPIFQDFLILK
ncbi:putative protein modification by small protein conjugation [Trypoxylus dichotomus]